MDLLGSILGSMQKPPTIGDEAKKKAKAQKEKLEKQQFEEKKAIQQFRSMIRQKIESFLKDATLQKLRFEPMDKIHRAVVHEIAEVASLATFSFGEEDVDRYVMIWKKEFAPSDDELESYKNGESWDPLRAKELAKLREEQQQQVTKSLSESVGADKPHTDYKDKYERLIGKDAAQAITANRQYGFVPAQNKKDRRTIEETMADNRAKRQKKGSTAMQPDDETSYAADSKPSGAT